MKGEIRNINEPLAERLIEQGIVAQHEDESGSGGGGSTTGGIVVMLQKAIDENYFVASNTFSEIFEASISSPVVLIDQTNARSGLVTFENGGSRPIPVMISTSIEEQSGGSFTVTYYKYTPDLTDPEETKWNVSMPYPIYVNK